MFSLLSEDLKLNKGNIKSLFVLRFYRYSNFFVNKNFFFRIIGLPIRILNKIIIEWFMCIEIPERTTIGKGIRLYHGQGLVIHPNVIIGEYVILRHNITIGKKSDMSNAPVLGNYVDIGSNCVIIGEITIGNNVTIGAGSVVVKSIPDNATVVGVPARIIKMKKVDK